MSRVRTSVHLTHDAGWKVRALEGGTAMVVSTNSDVDIFGDPDRLRMLAYALVQAADETDALSARAASSEQRAAQVQADALEGLRQRLVLAEESDESTPIGGVRLA